MHQSHVISWFLKLGGYNHISNGSGLIILTKDAHVGLTTLFEVNTCSKRTTLYKVVNETDTKHYYNRNYITQISVHAFSKYLHILI